MVVIVIRGRLELIAGGDPVRAGNAMTNWSIFGAILLGGYRLWKRVRS